MFQTGSMAKNPYLLAAMVQCISAVMFLLSKAAFNEGMNSYIFIFYRQAVGTLFMYPFAMIFERKPVTPLTVVIFCKIFLLAFLGITVALNLMAVALVYTSASLASATLNCLPVMTFFFAFLLRMEKVNIRTRAGVAKVVGIIMCMGGVAILAFYKGPHLKPLFNIQYNHAPHVSTSKTWVKGCFMSFITVGAWALWFALQTRVLESYPSKLYFTSIQCLSSAIQSFAVAIFVERDLSEWKLGWNLRLLAIIYCGTMVTGLSYYLAAWVIEMKGPVFQSMFTPLNLVITTIGSWLLLGEAMTLSSILGGILLVGSLYSVLWGKSTESHNMESNAKADGECVVIKDMEMN